MTGDDKQNQKQKIKYYINLKNEIKSKFNL